MRPYARATGSSMTRARPRIRVDVSRCCRATTPAWVSRASTFRAPEGEQPSSRASVAAPRPSFAFTEPPTSCSQPDARVFSTISSSPSRSVAAPLPVRPASSPGGVGSLSSGVQPGPNRASMRCSSVASSAFVRASGCPAPPLLRAFHSGMTRQSSPVGCPFTSVTTWVCSASVPRSTGSTLWWTVDSFMPSQRPSSAPQIEVWLSFFSPFGARDFAYSTTAASFGASFSSAIDGSASSVWTASRSRNRIARPRRSGSARPLSSDCPAAGTDRSAVRCPGSHDSPTELSTSSRRRWSSTVAGAAAVLIGPPPRP